MKRGATILALGFLLGLAGFAAAFYHRTADSRQILNDPNPELAWLKHEFGLSAEEMGRISKLHQAYLPQCAARCRQIDEKNQKLQELILASERLTPEIQNVLLERAQMRAECEAEMLKHFLEVSRTMPAEQGRRYLQWVEKQTFLNAQGMEQLHQSAAGTPATGHEGHHH
jgi:hypothetical protein